MVLIKGSESIGSRHKEREWLWAEVGWSSNAEPAVNSSADQLLDPGTRPEAASSWNAALGSVSLSVALHCTDLLKDFAGSL